MRRLLVLALALGATSCGDDSAGPDDSNQLVVGALLSLTGPGRTLGQTSEAALQLAADDLNARLSAEGSPTRVSLRIQDTGLDPAVALDRLQRAGGTRACGSSSAPSPAPRSPRSSRSPTAPASCVLSQGSTAGSLSIPDDNVFRLVPDDAEEGEAMVELLRQDGIETVVPLWREDAGNQGLHDAVERLFQEAGGTVTAGASYRRGLPISPRRWRRSDRRSRPRSPRAAPRPSPSTSPRSRRAPSPSSPRRAPIPRSLRSAGMAGMESCRAPWCWPIPTPPPSPRRRSSGRRPTAWTISCSSRTPT